MNIKKPRRVVISISIPDDLLNQMDICRMNVYPGITRSKYLEKLITDDIRIYELVTKGQSIAQKEDQ